MSVKEEIKSEGAAGGSLGDDRPDSNSGLNDFQEIDSNKNSGSQGASDKEFTDLNQKKGSRLTETVQSFAERFKPSVSDLTGGLLKKKTEEIREEVDLADNVQPRKSKEAEDVDFKQM